MQLLKRLVVVKVLDRVGPREGEHGQYLKRHRVHTKGQGFEWLEDPKHLAAIIRNRSKVGAKPQSSLGGKDFGRSDPEALDELEEGKESCISKIQASISTCPVEDSTFSSV